MAADDLSSRPADGAARIRPFVLTSGRVSSISHVGLETQVARRQGIAVTRNLTPELTSILAMCGEPKSVAEISALVPLHFGVARVLVGDLSAAGLVDVYTQDEDQAQDPELIMRVIRGLRNLL